MPHYKGRIVEILLEPYQNAAARIMCVAEALPKAGQYLQAHDPNEPLEVVPFSLFVAGASQRGEKGDLIFPVAGPLPENWQPGTLLQLRGPLGRGFALPPRAKRIALAALGVSSARLLALLPQALERGAEITLFCDESVGELPLAVEVRELKALPAALKWADYLAIDAPLNMLDELASLVGKDGVPRSLPAQMLVSCPMPCGGLAQCGVCAVATNNGMKLVCEDGPVFDLNELVAGS